MVQLIKSDNSQFNSNRKVRPCIRTVVTSADVQPIMYCKPEVVRSAHRLIALGVLIGSSLAHNSIQDNRNLCEARLSACVGATPQRTDLRKYARRFS